MTDNCFLVGLTGQTGAGKTTVSTLLAARGFAAINADAIARAVVEPDTPCLRALTRVFGQRILHPDGALDRPRAAALIFGDSAAKQSWQAIIFPYITKAIRAEAERLAAAGKRIILLDAPTLFESGIDRACNAIVSVTAKPALRSARIMQRDGISAEAAKTRMNAQYSEQFFRQHSDFIIENNGDETALTAQIPEIAAALFARAEAYLTEHINPKEEPIMEKKDELKALKEKLLMQKTHAVQQLDDKFIKDEVGMVADDYMDFLNESKTEREAAESAAVRLKASGFHEWKAGEPVQAGDRIYCCNRGKAIVAAVIGSEPLENGIRLTAAHIDSPRLDLKQSPLYEDGELALFKTHYYGGIKKYQWTAIPLALHGVIMRKDGEQVSVNIGEADGDPIFCITDLLPHLAQEQSKRTLSQGIKGEELNVLIGSHPMRGEGSDLVKLNIMRILNEKCGITEEDFLSAELEVVPAGKARSLGFDESMIAAYGHDDRVCAYPALRALIDTEGNRRTAVLILTDKEEIGSEGNTGLQSSYFCDFMEDLAEAFGTNARTVFANSQCLSADVTAAFDPTFADVNDRKNCAYLNYGVCMMKYTGARGKSGSSDASAEFIGAMRGLFDRTGVIWQTGELGKVDAGGGGTVAAYLANLNIDTVDVGVPVLSMHAPLEVVSKIDVYMCYKAMYEFYRA